MDLLILENLSYWGFLIESRGLLAGTGVRNARRTCLVESVASRQDERLTLAFHSED